MLIDAGELHQPEAGMGRFAEAIGKSVEAKRTSCLTLH
jgi:hypothetical protein